MAFEKTCIILKPEAVERRLVGKIISRIEEAGFTITEMSMFYPLVKTVSQHYSSAKEKHGDDVFNQLVSQLTSGAVVLLRVEGLDVVRGMRGLAGDHYDPPLCAPGTIRHDYSDDCKEYADAAGRSIRNVIHTSDSIESARSELSLWCGERLRF